MFKIIGGRKRVFGGRKRAETGVTRYFSRPRAGCPPHLNSARAGGHPDFESGPFGRAGESPKIGTLVTTIEVSAKSGRASTIYDIWSHKNAMQ